MLFDLRAEWYGALLAHLMNFVMIINMSLPVSRSATYPAGKFTLSLCVYLCVCVIILHVFISYVVQT